MSKNKRTVIERGPGSEHASYSYYHSEECQPASMIKSSGLQWPIPLADLVEDCVCAGCGGNIHEPPRRREGQR